VAPYLNSFSFGYRPNSSHILNYLFAKYLFRNAIFRKKVIKLAQGSTRYNISKVGFMKIVVSLPHLEEQEKIGNLLLSIDKLIESKNNQITNVIEWKKGLMQELFV
jgi:type I restriction enzyme S subunit